MYLREFLLKFIQREGTKVSNVLECRLQYWANRKVFHWRWKLSIESSGSCRYSGKLFQVVGPATANERGPTLQVEQLVGYSVMTEVDRSANLEFVSSWWMMWWMAGCRCDQPILGWRSHCSSSWLQLTSTSVGKLKPFQNGSGTMCCKSCLLAQDTKSILWLWCCKQTMSHIVNHCPLSRFPDGLTTLHLAGEAAGHAVQTIRSLTVDSYLMWYKPLYFVVLLHLFSISILCLCVSFLKLCILHANIMSSLIADCVQKVQIRQILTM